MSNPSYEFVVYYNGLSKEQFYSAIDGTISVIDSMTNKRLSARPGFPVPTQKQLTINLNHHRAAIAIKNTYEITVMIRDHLLGNNSDITLYKDIEELKF
ncbi:MULTISPECIES: hypothetical protein [Providencia]|uniref:Uncharacterized protein n=1 Tax=Providencia hangzhouensis TaxID=3031799 RepID=A0ABY9Z6C9_9GAMM|nr:MULTISPECIES: hypothetical protein [Providencia]WNK23040.1 hypothetical protein PZ638_13920 [Providencia hangzhouensis]